MFFVLMKCSVYIVFALLLPAFAAIPTIAQSANDDVLRIDTDLITFEATVTDASGKPVTGLKAADFTLYENGVERPLAFFEQQRKEIGRPLSIVFALDVSGSMTAGESQKLRNALGVFSARLANAESYFAVTTFGMRVRTLQSFTNRADKLERAFDKVLREDRGLSTHAYDAIDDGVRLLNKKAPKTGARLPMRKLVIVVTDGFPVGDTVAPATVIERANTAEVSVFNVILPSYSKRVPGKKPLPTPLDLSGLAEKTGGSSFYLTGENFDALFRRLAEEITSTYLIAFYPDDAGQSAGQFRPVKIEIKDSERKGLRVKQNRGGYTVPKR